MSRQGKHRDDKHRVQAYYEAHDKALFVLVSKVEKKSITDMVLEAVKARATQLGILDKDGKPTPDFKEALEIETSIIKQSENERSRK